MKMNELADELSTVKRIVQMFFHLPYISSDKVKSCYEKGKTSKQILEYLIGLGYDVTIRTIQRDLNEYSGKSFPLAKYKCHWYWSEDYLSFLNLSKTEQLVVLLMQEQLSKLLPVTLFTDLPDKTLLTKSNQNDRIIKYVDKIASVPSTLKMVWPDVETDIISKVKDALYEEKQLEVVHFSLTDQMEKTKCLHPLGLIQNGQLFYLIAHHGDTQNFKPYQYALHRFKQVDVLCDNAVIPGDFSLKTYIDQGAMNFASEKMIKLKLRINHVLYNHLSEVKLSEDQTIKLDTKDTSGEHYILTAKVNYSWRLFWWLMSDAHQMTVLSPLKLKNQIMASLKVALKNYENS